MPEITCPWGILPSRSLVPRPDTDEALRLAMSWIRQCKRGHNCEGISSAFRPIRLVRVGDTDEHIRLEETAETRGRYVFLSYCRRSNQSHLRTDKKTLKDHQVSISWTLIPKTFQDAIHLTRRLGIQYLWIDALCIVQDDESERIQQHQRIDQICGNAFLTVAAISAEPSSGFYGVRDVLDVTGITSAGDTYWIVARRKLTRSSPAGNATQHCPPEFAQGQVLEERLLSARVLHITSSEIVWECKEATLNADGGIKSLGKLEYAELISSHSPNLIARGWRHLIEQYSAVPQLYGADKLASISILARQISARRPNATYLAGLWSDSLVVDLLWHNRLASNDPEQRAKRPKEYRAPSWSWAAVDGTIAHPELITMSFIEVIEARTFPASKITTGLVSGGFITVRGHVFAGTTHLERTGARARVLNVQGKEVVFFADYRGRNTNKAFQVDVPDDPWITAASGGDLHKLVPVLCLRMGREKRPGKSGEPSEEKDYALVLLCTNREEKVYMRVGMLVEARRQALRETDRVPLEKIWEDNPGCFEAGVVRDTITII